jgi:hypothetical protein
MATPVKTTVSSAVGANDTKVTLTSATGLAVKGRIIVDDEWMRVADVSLTPTIGVVRGYDGTQAVAHGVLAPVSYGNAGDFNPLAAPPFKAILPEASTSYGADGAIAVPNVDSVIYLCKATAGAYTLVGPNVDSQVEVTFISTTAAAHTITYTAGFYGNTTSSDVATFPATVGGTFKIRAQGGVWVPLSTVTTAGVTLG